MRSLPFFALTLCAVNLASVARASEDPPAPSRSDPTTARAVEAEITLGYGSIHQKAAYGTKASEPFGGFEGAILYRMTPRLSFGAVGSHMVYGDGQHLSRAAGEARWHPVRTRFVDVWSGVELGFGFAKYAPYDRYVGDCAACSDLGGADRTRVGPEAGLGAGVELLPVPWVSLGVVARGSGVLLDAAPRDGLPGGPTPFVFLGASLAAHLPLL